MFDLRRKVEPRELVRWVLLAFILFGLLGGFRLVGWLFGEP